MFCCISIFLAGMSFKGKNYVWPSHVRVPDIYVYDVLHEDFCL